MVWLVFAIYFRFDRHSGIIASNVHKSDLRTAPPCVRLRASEGPTHLCEFVQRLPVTRAKDYSYLKATIGSTRIARRAGM